MAQIRKNDLVNGIIIAFFSALFTWLFTFLTNSLNPLIVLYTILSALGTLIIYRIIEKLVIKSSDYILYWFKNKRYFNKVDRIAKAMKADLVKK